MEISVCLLKTILISGRISRLPVCIAIIIEVALRRTRLLRTQEINYIQFRQSMI